MVHTVKGFSIVNEAEVDVFLLNEIKRCLLLGRKAMTNLDNVLENQRHHLTGKGPFSQSYGFSWSHVQM